MTYNIHVEHDAVHGVYYVLSSDIPGLHVEAPTTDELLAVIRDVIHDLLPQEVGKIEVVAHQHMMA